MKSVSIVINTDDVQWEATQWGIQLSSKDARDIIQEWDDLDTLENYKIQMVGRELQKILASKNIHPKNFPS